MISLPVCCSAASKTGLLTSIALGGRDMIRYGRYARLQRFVVEALVDNAVAVE